MTEVAQPAAALIRGLRRPGYEPQLTQALASVFRADPAMGSQFVGLLLGTRDQRDLAAQIPGELACSAEEVVEDGRVDLRFRSDDWDLIVELKIHAGYGRDWLNRYLDALEPVPHAYVLAITRDVPVAEPPPRDRWLGAVRWRHLLSGLRVLTARDASLGSQWVLFLDVLEMEGSMGFTRPRPELFDAFATSGSVMRHMTDFLHAIEHPLLDALIDSLGGGVGAARPYLKHGTYSWSRGGRVDIPYLVPADGPARLRAGLIGSVPPTAFFVQPHRGQQWLTRRGSLSPEAQMAVTRLRQGSFDQGDFRAKLPLHSELLARPDFEEYVVGWARERFDEIVASGLLAHSLPGTKADVIVGDEPQNEA